VAEIIDNLPSHPPLLDNGVLATVISQELRVFNEETVIAAAAWPT